MARYERACLEGGAAVRRIELDEARSRFPAFRLPDGYATLSDDSASVIGAADTLDALESLARLRGAEILEETPCLEVRSESDAVVVETSRGELRTERLIVTAGSWTRTLVPELAPVLTPVRQAVGYFELGSGSMEVGDFPCWIHLGSEPGDVHYGLPRFQRPGLKAAQHRLVGATPSGDDPEPVEETPPEAELDELRAWFESVLSVPVGELVGSERCLYTVTAGRGLPPVPARARSPHRRRQRGCRDTASSSVRCSDGC